VRLSVYRAAPMYKNLKGFSRKEMLTKDAADKLFVDLKRKNHPAIQLTSFMLAPGRRHSNHRVVLFLCSSLLNRIQTL
jgi:hypothetical protein